MYLQLRLFLWNLCLATVAPEILDNTSTKATDMGGTRQGHYAGLDLPPLPAFFGFLGVLRQTVRTAVLPEDSV